MNKENLDRNSYSYSQTENIQIEREKIIGIFNFTV